MGFGRFPHQQALLDNARHKDAPSLERKPHVIVDVRHRTCSGVRPCDGRDPSIRGSGDSRGSNYAFTVGGALRAR